MALHLRQVQVGLNIATNGSWGTGTADATAVGAGDGLYVTDLIDLAPREQMSEDDSAGQNFIGSVQVANSEAVAAAIPLYLHFFDTFLNPLWALAFGTGDTTPNQLGASTAYTGTFEPAVNKTGLYATLVQDLTHSAALVQEVPGLKVTGFTITTEEMGRLKVEFPFVGDTVKVDSAVNTATQVSNLTFPTQGLRCYLDDSVFRVNAQGGGALAASDAIALTKLTMTFAQPLDVRHVAGQTTIIEPEESSFPEVSLAVECGRLDTASDDYFAGHKAGTRYKADLTITGPAIGTLATTYALLFQFPHLYVSAFSPGAGAGGDQVIPSVTFKALSTTTAPTGMTGVTVPIRLTTTGERTANPFA